MMKLAARRLAVFWILLCATSLEASETWIEIHSPHFVLISNAKRERAESVLERVEQFRSTLARVLLKKPFRSEVPTQIYAFRDFDSFESFLPRTEDGVTPVAGYFRAGPFKNVIALDVSAGRRAYELVVFHEVVHLLLSLGAPHYPLWFEEGMAEFYAGTRLTRDGADVGAAEGRHRLILAEHPLFPMEELLLAGEDWTLGAAPRDQVRFYAESWALVHYLVVGRGQPGRLELARYLSLVDQGGDRLESVREAFGESPEELGDALGAYVEKGNFSEWHYVLAKPDRHPGLQLRSLTPAEVQHRWGELFLAIDRRKQARVCLEEACRLDPDLSRAWESRGLASLLDGARDDALRDLKRAMEGEGASPEGLYQYARALLQDLSGHWVKSIPDDLAREAKRALTRSLELKADQSETERLLAFVYLVRGERLEEATELIESALEVTPGRPSLLYMYAQLLVRRGDTERAREMLTRLESSASEPSLREASSELLSRMEAEERAPRHR